MAKRGRQFAYYYAGAQSTPEVEVDMFEEMREPVKDDVIERNGKKWRVVATNREQSLSQSGPIPVIKVFLQPV